MCTLTMIYVPKMCFVLIVIFLRANRFSCVRSFLWCFDCALCRMVFITHFLSFVFEHPPPLFIALLVTFFSPSIFGVSVCSFFGVCVVILLVSHNCDVSLNPLAATILYDTMGLNILQLHYIKLWQLTY